MLLTHISKYQGTCINLDSVLKLFLNPRNFLGKSSVNRARKLESRIQTLQAFLGHLWTLSCSLCRAAPRPHSWLESQLHESSHPSSRALLSFSSPFFGWQLFPSVWLWKQWFWIKKKKKRINHLKNPLHNSTKRIYSYSWWPCCCYPPDPAVVMYLLAACHTQNSTSGHPAGGKRPTWPVSQQLDWQVNTLRTMTIVCLCIFRNTRFLCVCLCVHVYTNHTYNNRPMYAVN